MDSVYLDHNATTPIDIRVLEEVKRCFLDEYGNAGSPHEFGTRAKHIVNESRERIAKIAGARRHEVLFTSGATESNNLALLGLADYGTQNGKMHIVSSKIEHKSVLEPLEILRGRGFHVTLVPPSRGGDISAEQLLSEVRSDTLLVSIMQVNNETGVVQPIQAIAEGLNDRRDVYLHVDASQGFAKGLPGIDHERIDLISVSSHKLNGPTGVGALIARKRGSQSVPFTPLMYGGGQELGIRPGTLPVALLSGFGLAVELAYQERFARLQHCLELRDLVLSKLAPLNPVYHGDSEKSLPHVLCVSFPGWHSDDVIEELSGIAAVSTGSACTSICASASHVLSAMRVSADDMDGAVRLSWSHVTSQTSLSIAIDSLVRKLMKANQEALYPTLKAVGRKRSDESI